jgi:exosortase A
VYMNLGARSERIGKLGAFAVALAVVAALIALMHRTALEIALTWYSSNAYNHGFLILPICAYLVWQKREELALIDRSPSVLGLAAVILSAIGWLIGHVTGTLVVQEFALITMVQSTVFALFGWMMVRTLAFPLLYLLFAVPAGEAFVPPLQEVTAHLAVLLVRLAGIPVFRDGNIISIPSGNFYVAEACSGVRYLVASVALGVLFAGLVYRTWWRRALFVSLSIIIPVVANGIRAFGIIGLAYWTNNELAVGVDHIIYGWIFFTLVTFVMLGVGMMFREDGGAAQVQASRPREAERGMRGLLVAAGVVIALALAAKLCAAYIDDRPIVGAVQLVPPVIASDWHVVEGIRDPAPPKFAAPDAGLDVTYGSEQRRVYLHIGYYIRNRRGAQIVSSDHVLSTGRAAVLASTGQSVAFLGAHKMTVQSTRFVTPERERLIWLWYWVDGRFVGNSYVAKLLEAKAKLLGGENGAAVIAVATDYTDRVSDAQSTLRNFVSKLDGLGPMLSRARH